MKILLISATCSNFKYKSICNRRLVQSLDTNQKFFLSIIDGFKDNGFNDITCVSVLPVSYRTYPERFIKASQERINGVDFLYCKTINYPVIRTLYSFFQVLNRVKEVVNEFDDEMIVITDGLFLEFSIACKYLQRKKHKVFTVVTDIPSFATNSTDVNSLKGLLLKAYGKMANLALNNYDGYVLLTEEMNEICNLKRKPYVVVEGLLGHHIFPDKKLSMSDPPKVLYAGKYNREFGALNLAKASPYLKNICNIEMYGGNGDCIDELCKIDDENDNLKVNGIIDIEELLLKETEADLLINPRPAGQLFTKYSFPSKTLEYMSSGTPVLMYRLEGIPKEYDDYLFFIDGPSPSDIANSISVLLAKDKSYLYEKGQKAKDFVRENKNAKVQANKILNFVREYEGKKISDY